jgi:hypothetical protein
MAKQAKTLRIIEAVLAEHQPKALADVRDLEREDRLRLERVLGEAT